MRHSATRDQRALAPNHGGGWVEVFMWKFLLEHDFTDGVGVAVSFLMMAAGQPSRMGSRQCPCGWESCCRPDPPLSPRETEGQGDGMGASRYRFPSCSSLTLRPSVTLLTHRSSCFSVDLCPSRRDRESSTLPIAAKELEHEGAGEGN